MSNINHLCNTSTPTVLDKVIQQETRDMVDTSITKLLYIAASLASTLEIIRRIYDVVNIYCQHQIVNELQSFRRRRHA